MYAVLSPAGSSCSKQWMSAITARFSGCSRVVRPKCALNARLKQERFSNPQREAMVSTVLLCFLQKRWISHVCFLLMIGLYHNLHYLGKILRVLCGISCGRDVKPAFRIKGGPIYELY